MDSIRRWMAALKDYTVNSDPRAEIAAKVALIVAFNQPFYPLYFRWAVSPAVLPSLVTFLSTPFFAIVPTVMKRSTLLGRVVLLVAGIGNTVLCLVVFGPQSGVGVFLFPCLMLSVLLFRRRERIGFAFAAVAFAVHVLSDSAFPAPLHAYTEQEYAALRRLNFLSAAGLTVMISLLFANASEHDEEIREARGSVNRHDSEETRS
ncbi:hypothetical protein [Enterovirga rhinocerotis]|uniref:Adenylate cyclase MASE7 domain-containing protein n=1 Tax=Enterovirga rhinocerotis TaxID=1339210 RepID=A0A4R7C7W3_9HYPH|nr:hypothetical protein [Enterovirga rhinocerotis]TDR94273.1 hypothetical protein EV668_1556 [Enterovirga rhinocerotis]